MESTPRPADLRREFCSSVENFIDSSAKFRSISVCVPFWDLARIGRRPGLFHVEHFHFDRRVPKCSTWNTPAPAIYVSPSSPWPANPY